MTDPDDAELAGRLTPAQRRWLVLLAVARDMGLTAAEIAAPRPVMDGLVGLGLVVVVSDGGWALTPAGSSLSGRLARGEA